MFTVAHSITLSLGVFGLVSLPPQVIEPLIALSIAYIAIENLLMDRPQSFSTTSRFWIRALAWAGFCFDAD